MNKIIYFLMILAILSCTAVQERLAIKECKFSLISVRAYDFDFSDMNLDFVINIKNPNKVDAVLDKLTYTFYANETDVFSGTTGQGIKISAGKSKNFTTTISLEYSKIGQALIDAITFGSAQYKLEARAYVKTILGEISYPVEIELKQK